MAVPDWPGTYGYNMLLYPWQTWFAAPWDLFIEHGHRLLGAATGLLAIALVVVVWLTDSRRWLMVTACGALGLVAFQGVLGGTRVLWDARVVAMLHGCVGPLFFAYAAGLMVVTSRWWQKAVPMDSAAGRIFVRAAWITIAIAYLQLVLGATLRHVPLQAAPFVFRAVLLMHLVVAGGLAAVVLRLAWRTRTLPTGAGGGVLAGVLLPSLVAGQIALGAATYVAKYAFPSWMSGYSFAASYVVQEKSLAQSLVTTAHVATGSLILFVTVVLAMRSTRLFHRGAGMLACHEPRQTKMSAPRRRAAA
jgi:cytochrome c oxidase assembly protein subunit 15